MNMKTVSILGFAVCCALASMTVFVYADEPLTGAQLRAKNTQCVNNAQQLAMGVVQYCTEHGDYPASLDLVKDYVGGKMDKFVCPFDPKGAGLGYEFLLAGKEMKKIENPGTTEMIRAKFPSPDGKRTVAFADGHVERVAGK